MIEKIQQVEDNWQKPWITIAANTRNFFPQNLTGRRYAGGNAFLLLFLCEKFQYQTPVFMTFNQANEAGISVLKGSKSFPVYYFLFYVYHKETRKKITFEEYKALSREQQQEYNVIPTYKYYSVFNLDQTNFSDVRPEEWEALREKFRGGQAEQPEIDAMLEAKSWFCPIREQQGDRAFYSPLADYIVVPLRSQFVDMQSFYETLLHEMGHSTGHPTRLNRDLAHPFGSEEYGKEELTAEFAAALAGMFFGIAEHIRTENAAYLKSWIYVGCSQNHPYCGEWLPNQVFRKRGLRPIRGAGHSNSLLSLYSKSNITRHKLFKKIDSFKKSEFKVDDIKEVLDTNYKRLKPLLTDTSVMSKSPPDIEVKRGKITYSPERIVEIQENLQTIQDEFFKLKIIINRA